MSQPHSQLATGTSDAAASNGPTAQPQEAASTPSPRAVVARRALLGAALLGILADPLLRNEPWGVGLLVWMAAFAAVTVALVRQSGRTFSRESGVWLGVAVLFAAGLSWRDADMLRAFDVLAMLTALVLLAMSIAAIPVPGLAPARVRDLIRAAFGSGLDVATGVVPLAIRDAELHTALRPSSEGRVRRVGRALVITAPIVLVFTLLLTRADPVFGSFFTFPDVEVDVLLSHVVIAGFFAWVTAGWLRRSLLAHTGADTPATPFPLTLGVTDVTVALGALTLLFAAFVIVQIGWLFGGEALVLRTTGLSYADYARRGFFELTVVAGLLLPVLLAAQALIPDSDFRTLRIFQRLAVPLVVLLGAMMLSAGARMRLYVQYYGISTDRLYATAFMIWLAIVFVWLAVTVLRSRPRSFATGLVASGFFVLFTLNVLNPDASVARANLARGDAVVRAGAAGADVRYVASLGGDAVPVLVSALTGSGVGVDAAPAAERCASATILLGRWTGDRRARMARSWTQWNLARSRAARAVRAREAELRQLACPETRNEDPSVP